MEKMETLDDKSIWEDAEVTRFSNRNKSRDMC